MEGYGNLRRPIDETSSNLNIISQIVQAQLQSMESFVQEFIEGTSKEVVHLNSKGATISLNMVVVVAIIRLFLVILLKSVCCMLGMLRSFGRHAQPDAQPLINKIFPCPFKRRKMKEKDTKRDMQIVDMRR